jgi:hypothetical protein
MTGDDLLSYCFIGLIWYSYYLIPLKRGLINASNTHKSVYFDRNTSFKKNGSAASNENGQQHQNLSFSLNNQECGGMVEHLDLMSETVLVLSSRNQDKSSIGSESDQRTALEEEDEKNNHNQDDTSINQIYQNNENNPISSANSHSR